MERSFILSCFHMRANIAWLDTLGPFFLVAVILVLPSLYTPLGYYYSLLDLLPNIFLITPGPIFLLCNLIVLAIIIISTLDQNNLVSLQLEPFNHHNHSIACNYCHLENSCSSKLMMNRLSSNHDQAFCRSCEEAICEAKPLAKRKASWSPSGARSRGMVRSRSHQLAHSQPWDTSKSKQSCTLARSSSQNALISMRPDLSDVARANIPTESLTDDEVNQRFTSFIKNRLAEMQKEMLE